MLNVELGKEVIEASFKPEFWAIDSVYHSKLKT